ncbi:MAG: TonB family protein [Nitrosomonas sp.]|nr:TonB family protein [Nitrosomonas sp.]
MPVPDIDRIATSLEVVLVNSKTQEKPTETDILAQANLKGGGNTDTDRRAKTPFPLLPKSKPSHDDMFAQQKVKQLEQEAKRLMTAMESTQFIEQPDVNNNQPEETQRPSETTDLVQRSLDIARLQAQIAKDHDTYQKRPKRKFIGARTKEYRFARYVEDWRLKVERIGNLNYPDEARKGKLYGSLQLTVGIRADGSLESIGINRSSGEKILDEAAIRIVRLSGQNGFAPFPPEISHDTDVLHITRTWVFARSDTLISQ